MAPGGLPTPPRTCNGALVRKKAQRFSRSHTLLSVSRSHISPIGVPHCTSSHSCRHQPVSSGGGHADRVRRVKRVRRSKGRGEAGMWGCVPSNATVSPATAAKCWS